MSILSIFPKMWAWLPFVLLVLWPAAAQSTTNLPVRTLTVGGAQVTTDAYVDMSALSTRILPLDDRGGSASPCEALWRRRPGQQSWKPHLPFC